MTQNKDSAQKGNSTLKIDQNNFNDFTLAKD